MSILLEILKRFFSKFHEESILNICYSVVSCLYVYMRVIAPILVKYNYCSQFTYGQLLWHFFITHQLLPVLGNGRFRISMTSRRAIFSALNTGLIQYYSLFPMRKESNLSRRVTRYCVIECLKLLQTSVCLQYFGNSKLFATCNEYTVIGGSRIDQEMVPCYFSQ